MLVTCATCKSPVYVSTAAVATAPAEVVCAGCGAELVATATGEVRLRDGSDDASGEQVVALPGYEGGAVPVGSEPAGRLPRFLELVPAVTVPASEPPRSPRAEPRPGHAGERGVASAGEPARVVAGPAPAPAEAVREAPARTEPVPGGRDRGHGPLPAAAAAAHRGPVVAPQGRPGEPVAIFPPSAPGVRAIPVGAPSSRPSAAQPAERRPPVTLHPSGSVAHLAALGALGGALVVVGLAARWGLPAGAPARPPVATAPATPGAADLNASERALAHYHRANELLAAGQPSEALRELEACVAIAPELGVAYRSLGVAYMRLGRETSAIEAYERFLRLEPRHRDADEARRIIEAYRVRAPER